MTLRNSFQIILHGLLLAGVLPLHGGELDEQYLHAAGELKARHDQGMENMLTAYRRHLDQLIAAAQPRGDIESIAVYLDEKDHPGEGVADERIRAIRAILEEQIRQHQSGHNLAMLELETRYVRWLEAALAGALRGGDDEALPGIEDSLESARLRLAALLPAEPAPATAPPPAPERTLGPNLTPEGNFEEEDDRWRIVLPRTSRNRTAFVNEGDIGRRNRVLRVQQDAGDVVSVHRRLTLLPETRYEISWRTRLSRPWRGGIELRGYGTYDVGFSVSEHALRQLPAATLATIQMRERRIITPPLVPEWETHTIVVTALPHMDTLQIRIHPGEGEWMIDDVSVRPVLAPAP